MGERDGDGDIVLVSALMCHGMGGFVTSHDIRGGSHCITWGEVSE